MVRLEAHHRAARSEAHRRVVQDKGQRNWQLLQEREAGTIRCSLYPDRRPWESENDGVHRQPEEERELRDGRYRGVVNPRCKGGDPREDSHHSH